MSDDNIPILRVISVSKNLSKQFFNPDTGETLYYIDRDYGLKRGLQPYMDFRNPLSIDPNMVRINLSIRRT